MPTSATATAPVPASAPTTTGTLLSRPSHVDVQGAPAQVFAVQGINRFLCLFRRIHRYEGKPPGSAGGPVSDKIGLDNSTVCRESVPQIVFGYFEFEIPDEQLGAH
jgi:hypothetical protein